MNKFNWEIFYKKCLVPIFFGFSGISLVYFDNWIISCALWVLFGQLGNYYFDKWFQLKDQNEE